MRQGQPRTSTAPGKAIRHRPADAGGFTAPTRDRQQQRPRPWPQTRRRTGQHSRITTRADETDAPGDERDHTRTARGEGGEAPSTVHARPVPGCLVPRRQVPRPPPIPGGETKTGTPAIGQATRHAPSSTHDGRHRRHRRQCTASTGTPRPPPRPAIAATRHATSATWPKTRFPKLNRSRRSTRCGVRTSGRSGRTATAAAAVARKGSGG